MIEGRYSERGWKKGCCSKESSAIGEKVSVQNVVSKLWDREAVITGIRTAPDKTIVNCNLISGAYIVQNRKFLRKIVDLPNLRRSARLQSEAGRRC